MTPAARRGGPPRPREVALLALLAVAAIAQGCAPTAAQRAEADMAAIRRESDAKTLTERGRAFAAVGDHTRAEEYLASALEAGADPREVLPELMDVCVRTGRYRSAIQHGEQHLRKHPNDLSTRLLVGALYAALEESKHARAQLERIVGERPPRREDDGEHGDGDGAEDGPRPPPVEAHLTGSDAELKAQAHYLLGVVARDTDKDVVEADRHFRAYLQITPNGSHAEEARASLLKRVP